MSTTRMFIIACDNCGTDDADPRVGQFRARLKSEGWKFGKRDLCPDCQTIDEDES